MTYDPVTTLAAFHSASELGYPLLRDANGKHAMAYGVLNEDYAPGHNAYGIPHPGILLISPSGEVLAKFAVPGYRTRPPFDEVYEVVADSVK